MHSCSLLGAVACASLLGTMTHAGVVVTPSQLLWNQRVTNGGEIVGTESFNSYVGYYADTVTGVVGDVTGRPRQARRACRRAADSCAPVMHSPH
jgi:hypothetical protein